jgi:hypothetical protein
VQKLYRKNGREIISNGNGMYKSYMPVWHKSAVEGYLQGRLVNGLMDGAWQAFGSFGHITDYFKDGEYIASKTKFRFPTNDRFIYSVTGFDPHENVDIIKFRALSTRISDRFYKDVTTYISINDESNKPLQYENSINLNQEFRSDLSTMIVQLIAENKLKSFYSLIQFTVSEKSTIESVTVCSNSQVICRSCGDFILNNDKFTTSNADYKPEECQVFIGLLYADNVLIIPPYQYNEIEFE